MTRSWIWRAGAVALLLIAVLAAVGGRGAAARQEGTPTPYSCDTAATPVAEMGTGMGMGTPVGMDMAGMDMGTPGATTEFDQTYIDMMIPHHASIRAMAEAALPRLEDARLRELAQTIIDAQGAEIEELRGYRERFYGSPEPVAMGESMMGMVERMMPGMPVPAAEMMAQMDAATQVSLICAAADTDLAFIDLTIPHHRSAIVMSDAALDQATHDEIRAFAEKVIADQTREIEELSAIRQELFGSATPQPVGS